MSGNDRELATGKHSMAHTDDAMESRATEGLELPGGLGLTLAAGRRLRVWESVDNANTAARERELTAVFHAALCAIFPTLDVLRLQ